MAKLYYGQEDDKDVEDLLAQINDESILKMSVNTHQSTYGMEHAPDQKKLLGIDPELEARYASLKAPRPATRKKGENKLKTNVSSRSPTREVSRVERSSSDDVDSLDMELLSRLQALKGPSSQVPEEESNSDGNTPSLSEHLRALKSRRSKKSPQMSPSHTAITVGSSGWCAPTSPFKLIKALSLKKPDPEVSRSSSKTKDTKKAAIKRSLSHTSKEEDEVDPSAMVADVQRLIAAVSKEGEKKKEAMGAGDKRTFNMKDRDVELLKALEDEEAMTLEAEKVVAWAKDTARLEGSDGESDELDELDEVSYSDDDGDDSDDDDSTGAKKLLATAKKKTTTVNLDDDSDPEETSGKPKKRKGRRRWNFL